MSLQPDPNLPSFSWPYGQPPTDQVDAAILAAAKAAAGLDQNGSFDPSTEPQLFAEFRGPAWYEENSSGGNLKLDAWNFQHYARHEIKRLRELGFSKVDRPEITAYIFDIFRKYATQGVDTTPRSVWQYVFTPFTAIADVVEAGVDFTGDVISSSISTAQQIAVNTSEAGKNVTGILLVGTLIGAAIYFGRK